MAKQITGKKPQNMRKTLKTFLHYLGNHSFALRDFRNRQIIF